MAVRKSLYMPSFGFTKWHSSMITYLNARNSWGLLFTLPIVAKVIRRISLLLNDAEYTEQSQMPYD